MFNYRQTLSFFFGGGGGDRLIFAVNFDVEHCALQVLRIKVDALIGSREHGATVHNATRDGSAVVVVRRDSACRDHARRGFRVVYI